MGRFISFQWSKSISMVRCVEFCCYVMLCDVMRWGDDFWQFFKRVMIHHHFLGGSFVGCFSFWIGGCEVPLFAEIAATELSKCFLSPDVHREWHWTKYCSVCSSWNVDPISNPKAMKKVDLYYKTHEFQALFARKRFILEVATRARMQHDLLRCLHRWYSACLTCNLVCSEKACCKWRVIHQARLSIFFYQSPPDDVMPLVPCCA